MDLKKGATWTLRTGKHPMIEANSQTTLTTCALTQTKRTLDLCEFTPKRIKTTLQIYINLRHSPKFRTSQGIDGGRRQVETYYSGFMAAGMPKSVLSLEAEEINRKTLLPLQGSGPKCGIAAGDKEGDSEESQRHT